MKIVGVIVEYNPLHNGHVYHINEIKKLAKPDLIVAVMSSSFTMRGDLSIYDKFTKTKQALNNGIDIVIELPLALAMHRADIFAKNACLLLSKLNVDEIWIGSEENNIKLYEEYYQKFNDNFEYLQDESYKKSSAKILPFLSNDILGFSYYKAIIENNLNMKLHTIKREKSNYLDNTPNDNYITSALSIRNNLDLLDKYTPNYVSNNKNILLEDKLFSYIKYKILSTNTNDLKALFFVDEGIENKLYDVINYNNLEDFINYLSGKKYTKTRIKRMLMYILFNIAKNEINKANNIDFIRVLGYSNMGKEYLNTIKKDVKIYTNIKNGLSNILDIELKVSKIIDMIYNTNLLYLEQKGPQTI